MDPHKRLLKPDEAATLVGRKQATIRDWVGKGWLTPYAVGRNGVHLFLEAHVLTAERTARHGRRGRCPGQQVRT